MADETGADLAAIHRAVHVRLGRIAALPAGRAPDDILPGWRLPRFDRPNAVTDER